MRSLRPGSASFVVLLVAGCSLARGAIGSPRGDGGPDARMPDAYVADASDGGTDAEDADDAPNAPDMNIDAWTPECTVGAQRCDMTGLATCAAPGVWGTGGPCQYGCVAMPTPHCGVFAASNVDDALFTGGPDVTISGADVTLDTSTCASGSLSIGGSTVTSTVVPQTGGPSLCVVSVHTFYLNGPRLTIHGMPLVILSTDWVAIAGTIDVSAIGSTPGPGGESATSPGPRSGMNGAHSDRYSDGGGGGGALAGSGGSGGNGGGNAGTAGGLAAGGAGAMATMTDLQPLVGGGAGGRGGSGGSAGTGGGGGGALQISSRTEVRVHVAIWAGGGGGSGGGDGTPTDDNIGAGGGGGAGGGVLLEAPSVLVTAGAYIGANGGGGGGAAGCHNAGPGSPGTDGRASAPIAGGGTVGPPCGGGMSFGAAGGAGAGAMTPTGVAGSANATSGANGGGGGGGAGAVVIRAHSPMIMGTINPSAAPGRVILDVRVR